MKQRWTKLMRSCRSTASNSMRSVSGLVGVIRDLLGRNRFWFVDCLRYERPFPETLHNHVGLLDIGTINCVSLSCVLKDVIPLKDLFSRFKVTGHSFADELTKQSLELRHRFILTVLLNADQFLGHFMEGSCEVLGPFRPAPWITRLTLREASLFGRLSVSNVIVSG